MIQTRFSSIFWAMIMVSVSFSSGCTLHMTEDEIPTPTGIEDKKDILFEIPEKDLEIWKTARWFSP